VNNKNKLNIIITYTLHEGKEHGIVLKELEGYEFDLLIIPDAGTNDVKDAKKIADDNVDIIVLDHHEIDKKLKLIGDGAMATYNPYATIVNCKDGEYPNDTLAGVGVTYKFCKEYDKLMGYDFADKYLDLVAVGTIADAMDLRAYETRYLVLEGLKNVNNTFLKEIIEKQSFSIQGELNIMKAGWYIAPLINAVVRVGEMEEKIDTFKALLEVEETREYKPRKSKNNPEPQVEVQSLQKFMARCAVNIKARQDKLVKKGVEEINGKIKEKGLAENKVLIVDGTDILEKTFTGLVANKLAEAYKRPVILLKQKGNKDDLFGGSCRNYKLSPIINFQEFLNELGTFNDLAGHGNAFGFEIKSDNLIPTRDKINDILKNERIEDIYKVDYEIPIGRLKEKHVKQVGRWADIWGNTLDEPLFAITDIYVPTKNIQLLGEKANIIKIEKTVGSQTITFIKFFANEELYNSMILKKKVGLGSKQVSKVKLDIIGKFKINKWEENEYPQIEIVDFKVTEDKGFAF
jgi:single-stranded-DNA-specific exonuclease